MLAVFGSANAMLRREQPDQPNSGGASPAVIQQLDVRDPMLVDSGLIRQERDAPAANQADAVGDQHRDPRSHRDGRWRSDRDRPNAGGDHRTRENEGSKMHLSYQKWLLGIGICVVGCANAQVQRKPTQIVDSSGHHAPAVLVSLRDTIRGVLGRALADSAFPGAIAVVGDRNGELAEVAVGHLTWGEPAVPDRHTLWDLASLTKVVGTTTSIMRLVDEGKVDVNAPVQRYLPDWVGPGKSAVTVKQLLTHSSGLPSFKAYDRITTNRDSIDKLMFGTPLDSAPGRVMVYSDIGGYLLGKIVERVSGKTLDRFVVENLFQPVGMTETMFIPPRVVAAEDRSDGDRYAARRTRSRQSSRRARVLPRRRFRACRIVFDRQRPLVVCTWAAERRSEMDRVAVDVASLHQLC